MILGNKSYSQGAIGFIIWFSTSSTFLANSGDDKETWDPSMTIVHNFISCLMKSKCHCDRPTVFGQK